MLRAFLVWLATGLGKGPGEFDPSWSEQLEGSANLWALLEGTHVMALILFAGTIFLVDLRLLGMIFRRTPVSVISEKVLPLTFFGFGLMVLTGVGLFFAKPLIYYHSIWFRLKLIFLAVAFINILVFHFRVWRNVDQWDARELPPASARISAAVSLAAWILVSACGRYTAYNWFDCGKPQHAWVNIAASCATSELGAVDLKGRVDLKGHRQ